MFIKSSNAQSVDLNMPCPFQLDNFPAQNYLVKLWIAMQRSFVFAKKNIFSSLWLCCCTIIWTYYSECKYATCNSFYWGFTIQIIIEFIEVLRNWFILQKKIWMKKFLYSVQVLVCLWVKIKNTQIVNLRHTYNVAKKS